MAAGGYLKGNLEPEANQGKDRGKVDKETGVSLNKSISESTIYQNAIQPASARREGKEQSDGRLVSVANQPNLLRVSTSSSEEGPISDEIPKQLDNGEHITEFLNSIRNNPVPLIAGRTQELQPSTSRRDESRGEVRPQARCEQPSHAEQVLEDNVTRLIREVETSKARVLEPPGNNVSIYNNRFQDDRLRGM